MSDKRLTTATIDGITYKLGEELNVPIASTTTAGILKLGTATSYSIKYDTPIGDTKNYMIGIDGDNKAYVTVPSTTNTKIASKDTAGVVLIPNNSGLKLNNSTGALSINLKEGYGIGTSTYDNQNPSYLMLEKATDTTLGGIKTGYIASADKPNTYGVKINTDGNAYVYIPSGKEVNITSESNIILTKDTIIVNMDSPTPSIIITNSYLEQGDECELILSGINSLAISTSTTSGFRNENIKDGLYWENGKKPTFETDKLYRIKFTKIVSGTNSNPFGKYLVSYTSNYVNNQDNY